MIANHCIAVSRRRYPGRRNRNGDLIAGGGFTTAGGQTVNRIARCSCEDEPCEPADLNMDGVVNLQDLITLINNWG